jgi:hypothetical protein
VIADLLLCAANLNVLQRWGMAVGKKNNLQLEVVVDDYYGLFIFIVPAPIDSKSSVSVSIFTMKIIGLCFSEGL